MYIRRDKSVFDRMPDIMSADEVALLFGIRVETVRNLARKGEIPAFKIGPKLWRFRKAEIVKFNEEALNQ